LLDLQSQASSLQSQVNSLQSQIGDNRTEARHRGRGCHRQRADAFGAGQDDVADSRIDVSE
jgi:hypothetical protein